GEPPVVFDLSLVDETKDQMGKYLNGQGFFNSSIDYTIKYKKRRVKNVTYLVSLSEPYRIRNIHYEIPDDSIKKLVNIDINNTELRSNNIFNSNILDKERSRIAHLLNNNGYYNFTKDYIFYQADSALNNHQIDVTLTVKNILVPDTNDNQQFKEENHKVYYINNVYIYPDFKSFQEDSIQLDTLVESVDRRGDPIPNDYNLIYQAPLKIKPKVISRSMFIEKDEKYNVTDAQQSFRKINDLRLYKYVNIFFRESLSEEDSASGNNYLDCTVQLTRKPVHSYSIEAEGTNTGGDLGIGGYFVYQNKNLFRGGEIFYVRFKGAMEAQEGGTTSEELEDRKFLFFNTYEAGVQATLYVPKFLAPINQDIFSRYFRPITSISLGYNFQDRLEYKRTITNLTFGYEWSESNFARHILYPIDINLVKVNNTAYFDSILAGESERFRNQYTDHLILGLRYSYIFNNQEINKIKNFIYFRGNIETSGNFLNLIVNLTDAKKNEEGFQTVFGIRYSQFVKTDFDFRYYFMFDKNHSIATRAALGVAVPYGNSIDIPFEKGFYGGGANGMRAWPLRFFGPGAYPNTNANLERVGDIMFEANIEYRFGIYKVLKGGLFYDIGNIWLISENETFPGGQFEFKTFATELAMDFGLGVRLDFNYFIFRVDVAQRLKDPALPEGSRWVIGNSEDWFHPVYNLGIGYPF
ncbi:MAG: BamA/TamA family outer membrane protein, partial [Bacteroidales bacterium]|nr:BamA/TamA family outer membrane protein [Bacteroidales bacterium]